MILQDLAGTAAVDSPVVEKHALVNHVPRCSFHRHGGSTKSRPFTGYLIARSPPSSTSLERCPPAADDLKFF